MAVRAQSTAFPKTGLRSRKILPIAILVLAFLYPFIDTALGIGYAAFFAIGAYANAFLTSPASYFVRKDWVPEVMRNFWVALAVSWVAAAIFGVLLGAPTLRLRGDYLAIVTLGFGEIV